MILTSKCIISGVFWGLNIQITDSNTEKFASFSSGKRDEDISGAEPSLLIGPLKYKRCVVKTKTWLKSAMSICGKLNVVQRRMQCAINETLKIINESEKSTPIR